MNWKCYLSYGKLNPSFFGTIISNIDFCDICATVGKQIVLNTVFRTIKLFQIHRIINLVKTQYNKRLSYTS